jgi:L-malate glycosyltransferase
MSSLTLEQPAFQSKPCYVEAAAGARPLRVCYLIDELAAAGTETQLLALLRCIDRGKVQPYLCLLRGDSPLSQALEPEDVPVLRLGVGSLLSPRSALPAYRLFRFLRRQRIDVVQAYFPDSTFFGIPLAWLAGVPQRLRTRNNSGHATTMLQRVLGRCLNWLTTGTLTNCQAARASLLRDEQPNPDTVHVLENGVDLKRFQGIPDYQGPRTNEMVRIGAVANLRQVKGLDLLVDAAAALAKQNKTFVVEIVGAGSERATLEQQIAAAGLSSRVLLRGSCADVPGFLASLDVAVLCSRAEGLPNAVLEYMAAGRAIVATRVGAVPELIDDGVHGFLVPPNDAPALAAAIARFLDDQDLAVSCGAAARQRVANRYSRATMIRRFEDFYDRLPRR